MRASQRARAAPAKAERGPQIEQLGGELSRKAKPPVEAAQVKFLARRFRVAPTFAAIIAPFVFGGGRA